jgi:hypothetical protein
MVAGLQLVEIFSNLIMNLWYHNVYVYCCCMLCSCTALLIDKDLRLQLDYKYVVPLLFVAVVCAAARPYSWTKLLQPTRWACNSQHNQQQQRQQRRQQQQQ